ncbi:MAG: cobalamin biosynthesis protein CobD/CbiB [Alkalilacustris sp.]
MTGLGLVALGSALAALLIERAVGYPDALFRRIGHPVTWIGALIAACDARWNRPERPTPARRRAGVALVALLLALAVAVGALAALLPPGWPAVLVLGLIASSLIAQRSLAAHVLAVAEALETGGLPAGRRAVAQIVGRDPGALDEPGVARAAIESLAENFSDGIVAPALWLAALGPGGGVGYKALNTADSMVGHRTPHHAAFGWAAARTDDLVNLPAARLSALLIAAAALGLPGAQPGAALRAALNDARHHRSPNAGWPEAALAGALGFGLAGPRAYGGTLSTDPVMNRAGRRDLGPADIRAAVRLYWRACTALALLLTLLAALLWGLA